MAKIIKTESIGVRLTLKEKEKLIAYCENNDDTISHFVRKLIINFLNDLKGLDDD